jgi:hypothetical protein
VGTTGEKPEGLQSESTCLSNIIGSDKHTTRMIKWDNNMIIQNNLKKEGLYYFDINHKETKYDVVGWGNPLPHPPADNRNKRANYFMKYRDKLYVAIGTAATTGRRAGDDMSLIVHYTFNEAFGKGTLVTRVDGGDTSVKGGGIHFLDVVNLYNSSGEYVVKLVAVDTLYNRLIEFGDDEIELGKEGGAKELFPFSHHQARHFRQIPGKNIIIVNTEGTIGAVPALLILKYDEDFTKFEIKECIPLSVPSCKNVFSGGELQLDEDSKLYVSICSYSKSKDVAEKGFLMKFRLNLSPNDSETHLNLESMIEVGKTPKYIYLEGDFVYVCNQGEHRNGIMKINKLTMLRVEDLNYSYPTVMLGLSGNTANDLL